MSFINKNKLGIYAPKSNETADLAAKAEKELKQAFYDFKKIYFGSRQIAWKYRNAKGIFWEAMQNGELDEFKIAQGRRNSDGTYSKDEWNGNALNAYLWQRFCQSWESAMSLEHAENLKSYKDLKQAELELIEFVYENWGEKLLANYIPKADSLSEIGNFRYELDHITVKGKFTKERREITLSASGLSQILVCQTKRETSWKGGIHCNFESNSLSLNSSQAQIFGEMMALAGRLNVGIKEFMQDPEKFLEIESAKQRNLLLRHLKQVIIQMNDDYLAERNAKNKEENQSERQFNEVTMSNQVDEVDNDLPFEPEPQPKIEPQPKVAKVKKSPKSKKQQQLEAQAFLQAFPEYADDIDEELGLSTIDQ